MFIPDVARSLFHVLGLFRASAKDMGDKVRSWKLGEFTGLEHVYFGLRSRTWSVRRLQSEASHMYFALESKVDDLNTTPKWIKGGLDAYRPAVTSLLFEKGVAVRRSPISFSKRLRYRSLTGSIAGNNIVSPVTPTTSYHGLSKHPV